MSAAGMETGVDAGVGIGVEIQARIADGPDGALALRLLGPLALVRRGAPVTLPRSRKVRALLAYLALAPRPTSRSRLCELLWDLPSDPRGELRWCLSKLRGVLDEPGRARVVADGEAVSLDLQDCDVDALHVLQALHAGVPTLPADRLAALAALFGQHDLLEGLDLPRSPVFTGWLVAERRRLRNAQATVLEHWVKALPVGSEAAFAALAQWLAIAPFDPQAHSQLLDALAARGRLREGDEHLAAAARQYEAEGQDWTPIGRAWQAAKARHAGGADLAARIITIAPVQLDAVAAAPTPRRRASIAVMPFSERTAGVALRGGLGDGMATDVTTRLAKLRSMFVIAAGSTMALSEKQVDPAEAGRRLDVDYVVGATLRRDANARLTVSVQLTETRSAQVLWADDFSAALDDTFEVLDGIGNRIVASVANEVELSERNRAVLKNPNSLSAWEAHHRGVWHMMRFNREDNEQARHFFQSAVRLDPTFSRPHAGLSFTHFQDAFLGWRERAGAIEQAYAAAAEGAMADDRDPASHWALGRALWLKDQQEEALHELREAIELSPNFALGRYTLGFVHAQSGDPQVAIAEVDEARALSPLDPLLFGMLASRALALARLGRYEEAAAWAARSAARPNAHVHIRAIAMVCLALAGRRTQARSFAQAIQQAQPGYRIDDFLVAFKLDPAAQALARNAARMVDA